MVGTNVAPLAVARARERAASTFNMSLLWAQGRTDGGGTQPKHTVTTPAIKVPLTTASTAWAAFQRPPGKRQGMQRTGHTAARLTLPAPAPDHRTPQMKRGNVFDQVVGGAYARPGFSVQRGAALAGMAAAGAGAPSKPRHPAPVPAAFKHFENRVCVWCGDCVCCVWVWGVCVLGGHHHCMRARV